MTKAEYGALKSTFGDGRGILIFMVNQALEKASEREDTPAFQGVPASRTLDSQPETAQVKASIRSEVGARAEDSSPVQSERSMSPEELAAHSAMRQNKLDSTVNLGLDMIGTEDQTDSKLAEYLAGILGGFAADFWTHVISGLDDREAAYFGEVIELADEFSNYCSDLNGGAKDVYASRPFPRSFCLPGFAKYQVLKNVGEVLYYLADAINRHREAILKRMLEPSQDLAGRFALVEALVISQAVMDRAGGDDEIENCERMHTYPRLVQLSWKVKSEFYADKLRRKAATQEADGVADRAKVLRRVAA